MEPSQSHSRRPINPAALQPHLAKRKLKAAKVLPAGEEAVTLPRSEFVPIIQAEVGSDVPTNAYSYKVLIPVAQTVRGPGDTFRRVTIATWADVDLLIRLLTEHFRGLTGTVFDPPGVRGIGARDPQMAVQPLEENEHVAFDVYAAPIHESDEYFRALRKELQEALGEGVILIQRQQVTLL
jgi:hypothetical protein